MLKIDTYSHHFTITMPDHYQNTPIRGIMNGYLKLNLHYGYRKERGKFVREVKARYFAMDFNKQIFRLHINQLPSFLDHLRSYGYYGDKITIVDHPVDTSQYDKVEYDIDPKFTLKEIQEGAIEYALEPMKYPAKIVELKTGEGKSLVSMKVGALLQSRFVMMIRAGYIDKWYLDLTQNTSILPEEVYIVKGHSSLMKLFKIIECDKLYLYKAVLISTATFRSYISQYENFDLETFDKIYPYRPYEYIDLLKTRCLMIDEGHQEFHFLFKLFLYTNVEMSLTTTATLTPDDPFLKKMSNLVYPLDQRFKPDTHQPYIHIRSLVYKLRDPRYIRYESAQGYSHTAFEGSILKHKPTTERYFDMVKSVIDEVYIPNYEKGRKTIIFVSTVAMATEMTKYLQECYPDLDVRRYVSEDPYTNLMDPDIRVTTPGSASTAHDIPGLFLNILTVALSSTQSNKQTIGRLRPLKDTNPFFYFFSCEDIIQHMHYQSAKKEQYYDKKLSYQVIPYQTYI